VTSRPLGSSLRSRPIVLTLDPAFFVGTTALSMRGWAGRTGRVKRINYGAIPLLPFVLVGVILLDQALKRAVKDTTATVWVLGWSQGAQIIYKWLRQNGPRSTIPVDRVRFVSIGNPERLYGGAVVVPSPPRKLFGKKPVASYVGSGVPNGNRYQVIDFARQYDGWADLPNVVSPSSLSLSTISDAYHLDYFSVSIEDSDVVSFAGPNNVTYLLKPTSVPNKNTVEQSYSRPAYQPRN
jgi:hypothetical protein